MDSLFFKTVKYIQNVKMSHNRPKTAQNGALEFS